MKLVDHIVFVGGEDIEKKERLFISISQILGTRFSVISGVEERKTIDSSYFLSRNPFLFPKSAFSLFRKFEKLQKSFKGNVIVHSFDTIPNFLVGIVSRYLPYSWKIIRTVNGLGRLFSCNMNEQMPFSSLMRKLYLLIAYYSKYNFDFSIFQNKHDLSFYRENNLVIKGTEVIIPSSGVDLNFFDPTIPFRSRYILAKRDSQKKGIVSFIGRLLIEKGIQDFLYIAETLKHKFEFLIAGEIDEKLPSEVRNKLFLLHEEGVINYLGNIPREGVRDLLKISDVLLFLSRYGEGTPRIVLESLAMETPVICYDIPQIREVVIDGKTGIVVKNSKQVIDILLSKWNMLKKMKGLCRNQVVSHKIESIAQMHASLYMETFNK